MSLWRQADALNLAVLIAYLLRQEAGNGIAEVRRESGTVLVVRCDDGSKFRVGVTQEKKGEG